MSLLAVRYWVCIVLGAVASGPSPGAQGQASAGSGSAAPSGLTPEARVALERIRSAMDANERDDARDLLRETVRDIANLPPAQEPAQVVLLFELGQVAADLGSLEEARQAYELALAILDQHFPHDHPDIPKAKVNLAAVMSGLGDYAGARRLEEEVYEAWTRQLPGDDPRLLAAKSNLAMTMARMGDIAGARKFLEEVLATQLTSLSADDPSLLQTKCNLAVTRHMLGDLAGAGRLFEDALEVWSTELPAGHPYLLTTMTGVAATRYMLGDLAGARALQERVLEAQRRLLPPGNPDLLMAQGNLAMTKFGLGDLTGALVLFEEVYEAHKARLPEDHLELLAAMHNLAAVRHSLGDLDQALQLKRAVLEGRSRQLSQDHRDVLAAKLNLAVTMEQLGDLAGARELQEGVLDAWTRLLPEDHIDVVAAKQNLAVTLYTLGDDAGAAELFEAVLESREPVLPEDHPELLDAKLSLAMVLKALGEHAAARDLVAEYLENARAHARALAMEGTRSAREGARVALQQLKRALFLSAVTDPERTLEQGLFGAIENVRLASVPSSEVAHALAAHPELAEREASIADLRARLNDLVAGGPEDQVAAEGWRREVVRLAEERDLAERDLRQGLAAAGVSVGEIEAGALGARLAAGSAAVSFLRYEKLIEKDRETGAAPPSVDSLLAFVVQPGGVTARVELGAAADVEQLAGEWRAALGRPLTGRGIGAVGAAGEAESLEAVGARLRGRILDPVLAVAGDVRTLHVVLDDVLHLIPLDALPDGQGLVGERLAIRPEVTLARLLRQGDEAPAAGGLVLVGGLDYDAELAKVANVRLDASTPPIGEGLERSGAAPVGFAFLPGTAVEVEAIAELYAEVFGREAVSLTGATGSKGALHVAVPEGRFLHLATHGWFAGDGFRSRLDAAPGRGVLDAWRRAEETITGFAPETLCGLALAAANRGRDAVGRVPGILTAEELATFDLRNCELAVLSACETNVGIRRAGQGIQSLQTALHAAGARSAITSLWKVDDDAARRLFELFYTRLWKERLGKAEALWQAKMELRADGHPPRDWAGWVLSGDPE